MKRSAKCQWIFWCLPNFTRYSLTLLLSVILVSSVVVRATTTSAIAQSQTNSQDPKRAAAYAQGEQLLEQAQKLLEQGTAESRRQALEKYSQALKIWRELGVNEPNPKVARHREATTLLSIGTIYLIQSEPQLALEYFNQGVVIRRELKDRLGEAFMLNSLGNTYSNLGEKQKALDFYKQALSIFQAEKKPSLTALVLNSIGRIYFDLGQTQSSIAFYNQALEIQRAEKDTAAQADTLKNIGTVYTELGEAKKALDSLTQALEIQRIRKNLPRQVDILSTIGLLYASLSENQKALDSLTQALNLQRASQGNLSGPALVFNLSQQAQILSIIAVTYNSLGERQKAVDYFQQARSLMQKAGNRHGEAESLNGISFVYNQLGEKQKALEALNQALVLQRDNQDRARAAFTLNNIAGIYELSSEYQKALDFHNQALDLQRQVQDRRGEADTLKDMAQVYTSLGDYQLSVKTYTKALEIFKNIGDLTKEAQTLDHIGNVYRVTEDYQKSLDYYNSALKLWRKQGDLFKEFSTLTGVIRVYESLKDYPKALATANEALSLSRKQKSGFTEASALAFLGRVYLASGDYQKALDVSTQAASGLRKVGFRIAEANALGNIGKAYNSLKQPQQAIETYNQELALRRTLGDRTGEAGTLYSIATAERDRGNLKGAGTQIKAAIDIVESIRTKVTSQELRTSYFATVQKYYDFYIDLLMQLHKQDTSIGYDAQALHASERSRARGLLELLTEAHADIRKGVDPKLLAQERYLQEQINAREKRRLELPSNKNTEAQAAAIKKEIENLLNQYKELQTKIRSTSPKYASLKYPQPLTLPQIQQQLDKDTLLLQYSLGEKRSYLWAVTPNSLDSYELPGREQIEKAAKNLSDRIQNPAMQGVSEDTALAANELSKLILAKVANKLGQKRLLIVGDGALQYTPFAALTVPGKSTNSQDYQPLLVNHEIVSLPSASTIAILRAELIGRKKAPKTLAILADPVFAADDERVSGKSPNTSNDLDLQLEESALKQSTRNIKRDGIDRLKQTRLEAIEILKLVSPKDSLQALDFDASYNWVTNKQLSQYRLLHFATHGLVDSTNPELSGIVLSLVDKQGKPQRGFLRLNDIFNLNFPAELVVLSACETGLGKEVKGEGLVGLTRGLMYAGAARVVVSLWSVDDEATSLLMSQFYREMLQQGKSPTAALRAAQLKMWQQEKWRNPYSWAAFTLQGEWQ